MSIPYLNVTQHFTGTETDSEMVHLVFPDLPRHISTHSSFLDKDTEWYDHSEVQKKRMTYLRQLDKVAAGFRSVCSVCSVCSECSVSAMAFPVSDIFLEIHRNVKIDTV